VKCDLRLRCCVSVCQAGRQVIVLLCVCVSVCQAGRQVIDIRAMLNDATKLSHIDDTGDVSITSSSLLSVVLLGSQSLAWFHSYLIYHTHCSQSDSPVLPSSGVVQGPSLGSTTFLTYIEDTADIVSVHLLQCHLYADDTQSYL